MLKYANTFFYLDKKIYFDNLMHWHAKSFQLATVFGRFCFPFHTKAENNVYYCGQE